MANDYANSLAQQYVTFTTEEVLQTNPGEQFGKAMLFIDSATISGLWVGTPPQPAHDFELTSQNYQALTQGALLDILGGYFADNQIASIFVAAWDSSQAAYAGLRTAYSGLKYDAYFKTMYLPGLGSESNQNAAALALAQIAFPDTGVSSQVGFGTKQSDNLTVGSPTSLASALLASQYDAVLVYADAGITTDPWLNQLGITLGALNNTGTPVGNALDFLATSNVQASGASGANLGPASIDALKQQNVGYWATLGNNTGQAALYDPKTVKGAVYSADWLVAYLNFAMAITTVEWLTSPSTPQGKRRNNENYQAILGIIGAVAGPFTDKGGIGVLSGFTTAVAPAFKDLAPSGDAFIVPHAWEATFLQNAREVIVQGTLFIQV